MIPIWSGLIFKFSGVILILWALPVKMGTPKLAEAYFRAANMTMGSSPSVNNPTGVLPYVGFKFLDTSIWRESHLL